MDTIKTAVPQIQGEEDIYASIGPDEAYFFSGYADLSGNHFDDYHCADSLRGAAGEDGGQAAPRFPCDHHREQAEQGEKILERPALPGRQAFRYLG